MAFPISRANYRTLDPDWEGEVFVADIDRTYLATRFSSMQGLMRIPFETAADKRDIDGMARLLREIRRGPGDETRKTPLYFVSASPRQLRPVIEQKMALDGIEFDGTTFKDWGAVLRRLKWSRLREQVGFKLTALLSGRQQLPVAATEVLIGDDLEHDPLTYALYADIMAARIHIDDLERVLLKNGVGPSDAEWIVATRRELRRNRGVRRALIRMERHADAEHFRPYAPGIVGCRGAMQMAAVLWQQGSVSLDGVVRVAADLRQRGLPAEELADRLTELCTRGLVPPERVAELGVRLAADALIERAADWGEPDAEWAAAWRRGPERLWTPAEFVEL